MHSIVFAADFNVIMHLCEHLLNLVNGNMCFGHSYVLKSDILIIDTTDPVLSGGYAISPMTCSQPIR